ncbi:MAG: DUF6445 family protein [Acidobacteriota bacterium]
MRLEVAMTRRLIHVVDDFYPNPGRVRRSALETPFVEHKELGMWATQSYHPKGVRALLEKQFRICISKWDQISDPFNGAFYSAFSKGTRAEPVRIHYDHPASWFVVIIYMTPDAPYDAGTSLWQHRETGLIAGPTEKDAERLGISVKTLDALIQRDCAKPYRWREVDRIGNIYNRAVMFPGKMLHSATRHFGSNPSNGRIYQGFQFPLI